ncbi:MAG: F0F1 ATP synthase subunit delta [Gammaproteobacteria bacterium]|nr:F0F1 ATP synthase subunit delta [Gammaproteobacteria bacterium]MDH5304318.1 F0F1 ATP synthase subunit delta [Gammaproteobacteria bacterium]
MADNNTIARPYANAVFELAKAAGELASWSTALDIAGQLLADKGLVEYLGRPALGSKKRFEFLTGLFAEAGAKVLAGSDREGSNFLRLLLENKRIAVLPEIAAHFAVLKARVENTVDATVTSAAPMSQGQKDQIAAALKKRLGRDVKVTSNVDASLIGGAVIRAGDVVIDGSLRARLEGLANALIK